MVLFLIKGEAKIVNVAQHTINHARLNNQTIMQEVFQIL